MVTWVQALFPWNYMIITFEGTIDTFMIYVIIYWVHFYEFYVNYLKNTKMYNFKANFYNLYVLLFQH